MGRPTKRVVIIDNGGANVSSLRFALERLGSSPRLSTSPEEIRSATHVLLPGVGAAGNAMERLRASDLDTAIRSLDQPVLGICLGMQLLYEASDEGEAECLGVFAGKARCLVPTPDLRVPHMGWNQLVLTAPSPLLAGVESGDHVYFMHSFALPAGPETRAVADYGETFSAAVQRENFFATQFHPERSGATGARILANFLSL
jgi:glutamine amidotransferase